MALAIWARSGVPVSGAAAHPPTRRNASAIGFMFPSSLWPECNSKSGRRMEEALKEVVASGMGSIVPSPELVLILVIRGTTDDEELGVLLLEANLDDNLRYWPSSVKDRS